ncbi:MAG: hypothetical protein M1824_004084 [Vezdaea acicularis]|nr:MAG: hypothetical protein M1824_004084 [Vezdaea acicularis]
MDYPPENESAEFSGLVRILIATFTTGLDVVSRVRAKRRARKAKLSAKRKAEESALTRSLSKAPGEIDGEYRRDVQRMGRRFEQGDQQAHMCLTGTLLKLNAGLVNIIRNFLDGGRDAKEELDYASFTRLSDSSRAETVHALGALYDRLSRSSIILQNPSGPPSQHPRALDHTKKGKKPKAPKQTGKTPRPKPPPAKSKDKKAVVAKEYPNGALIQWKKDSAISVVSGSRSSSTSGPTSPQPTSPRLPPPRQLPQLPPPLNPRPPLRTRGGSAPSPPTRPALTPQPPPVPRGWHPGPPLPPKIPTIERQPSHRRRVQMPRRQERQRDSLYSFVSDSTKIGEIPERLWRREWEASLPEGDGGAVVGQLGGGQGAELVGWDEGQGVVGAEEGMGTGRGKGRFWRFWGRKEEG